MAGMGLTERQVPLEDRGILTITVMARPLPADLSIATDIATILALLASLEDIGNLFKTCPVHSPFIYSRGLAMPNPYSGMS